MAVAALGATNRFVTAVENSSFDLELIVWANNTKASQVQRRGSYTDEALASQFPQVITHGVDPAGHIARQGQLVERGLISTLALAALDSQHVVTVTSSLGAYVDTPTETAANWTVDADGNLGLQGTPWTIDNPGYPVAVAAMNNSQIMIAIHL